MNKGDFMNNWPHQSDVDKFYGDPRGSDGEVSSSWERENIVRVIPPWKLVTAWDFSPVTKGVRIHEKCADSLQRILADIWQKAEERQEKINEWGMNLYAGGYNFRTMRGSTRLSMHSWGCAVDFDSARNSFGDATPNFALIPAVTKSFADEAWIWGGKWHKADGMHFQAAML
jgi:hypothetical protein